MNWIKPTSVKVKSLRLPGDIQQRKTRPHVIELAESIKQRTGGRPIHLPTVEYPSMQLIAGRDRVAALLINGARSIEVQLVSQVTDKERRDLERDENIHRRVDDRDALIRQRVDEREAEIEAERRDVPPEPKPGRPKTARGEAREQVARELGTTPDAVRVAEARAAAAEADEEIPNKSSESHPPVETYGLPLVTDVEAEQLVASQAAVDSTDALLRRAQTVIAGLGTFPAFAGAAMRLAAEVHRVASDVRAAHVVAVCPYCKRLPALVGDVRGCQGCGGAGFVPAESMLGVADELKLGGEQAMVVVRGKLVPYEKAAKDGAPPPHPIDRHLERAAKATAPEKKRIRIEDEKGAPLWEPAEDDLAF